MLLVLLLVTVCLLVRGATASLLVLLVFLDRKETTLNRSLQKTLPTTTTYEPQQTGPNASALSTKGTQMPWPYPTFTGGGEGDLSSEESEEEVLLLLPLLPLFLPPSLLLSGLGVGLGVGLVL